MSDMHVYRFSLIQIGFSWSNALMQSNFKCSQWRRSDVFETWNIFHTSFYAVFLLLTLGIMSHLFVVFLLLTLNK